MQTYLQFLQDILAYGDKKEDRTNTGTVSLFGYQMRFDVSKGFPLLTTKKVHFKSILVELLWFIKGDTNIKYLVDRDVRIWNDWPYELFTKSEEYNGESMEEFVERIKADDDFAARFGELGPVYGKQWRHFEGKDGKFIDQLAWVIEEIKRNPDSRRLIVNSWNAPLVEEMALPPCHMMFQFYVRNNTLSLQLYQRSADAFLGVPFNIASYALLLMMVAQVCDLEVGDFVHTIGDAHIYLNHLEQVEKQLNRKPRALPTMRINPEKRQIDDFVFEDFELVDYNPHSGLKAKVAV